MTEPIPTLGYYKDQPLPALARLVLLAGAASGMLAAMNCIGPIVQAWPQSGGFFDLGLPSPLDGPYIANLVTQVLVAIGASIGCIVLLRSRRGRMLTIWCEAILIVSKMYGTGIWAFSYTTMGRSDLKGYWIAIQIGESVASLLALILVPILVLVMLTRKEMPWAG